MKKYIDKIKALRCFQVDALKQLIEQKISVLLVSRQIGKTELSIRLLRAFVLFTPKRNPHALILAKTHSQVGILHIKPFLEAFGDYPLLEKQGSMDSGMTITIKRPWLNDRVTLHFRGATSETSLIGLTCDLLILDEAAQIKKEAYFGRIRQIFDANPNSIKFIISTQEEQGSFFDNLHRDKNGITFTLTDAVKKGYRTKKWAEATKQEFINNGVFHLYENQYECKYKVASIDLLPFYQFSIKRRDLTLPVPTSLFCTIDVGQAKSNVCMVWSTSDNKNFCLHEIKSGLNNVDLIMYLAKEYKQSHFDIFYPHDITIPSTVDSSTAFDRIAEFVDNKGLERRFTLHFMAKTPSGGRKVMLNSVLGKLDNIKVALDKCSEGLEFLRQVKFKKDSKTGYIHTNEWERNRARHYGDSLLYFSVVVDDVLYDPRINKQLAYDKLKAINQAGNNNTIEYPICDKNHIIFG